MTVLRIYLRDLSIQVELQLTQFILPEFESVLSLAKFNLHLVQFSPLEIVLSNELSLALGPLSLLLSMEVLSILPLLSQLLDLILMGLLHGQLCLLSSPGLLLQCLNFTEQRLMLLFV